MKHYWLDPIDRLVTESADDALNDPDGYASCPGLSWTLLGQCFNPIPMYEIWGLPEDPPLRQNQRTDGNGQTERHPRMVQTEGGPSSTRAFGAGNNAYR